MAEMPDELHEEPAASAAGFGTHGQSEGENPQLQDLSLQQRGRQLEADLIELNETARAFKLLSEKQIAELNAKDILLARKSERIEELVQQLKARDAQVETRDSEVLERDTRIADLLAEVDDLQDQLKKEEDDFSMVTAALDAKEQVLVKKTQELAAAQDLEKQIRKELDRSQVVIRRLEKNVEELHPEQADACLSPRSFHENQLIQLRDDAIAAKSREVWLLTGQNDQLRVQLDELEAAMDQLQTSYISKENDVARQQRKIDKLEMEIEALQVSRSQAQGREKAMEIATTQNAKLLQALEAQERVSEEIAERAERAERECEQLRKTLHEFLEKSAVSEVEVIHKTKQTEEKTSIVNSLQEKLQRERKALQQELSTVQMSYQLEIEKVQSELVMRRNKQYELTLKLQDVEARLHTADDAVETSSEQLLATQCRMEELERVLRDALQWKKHLEEEVASRAKEATHASDTHKQQIRDAQSETAILKSQLTELKEALVKRMSQEKHFERQIQDFKHLVDSKEALVREQKDRIHRLVHEVSRESQARAELELEKQLVRDQLDKVRVQMEGTLNEYADQKRRLDEKNKGLLEKYAQLESEYAKAQAGKSKLVVRFADAFTAASMSARSPWTVSESLDLRECWLADHDLLPLLRMLEHAPEPLVRVDLRSNRITQDGARALTVFVKKLAVWVASTDSSSRSGVGGHCRVRDIDLRNNFISLDGVRTVASGLESLLASTSTSCSSSPSGGSSGSGIRSVVVKDGGRIECFFDDRHSKVDPTNGGIPVLVVDMTSNFDADVLVAEARKINRRRGRELDGGAANYGSNNNSNSNRDSLLQEVYGADLVSTFVGNDRKVDSSVASVSTRRKASTVVEKDSKLAVPVPALMSSIGSATSGEIPGVTRGGSTISPLRPASPFTSKGNSSSRLSGSSSLPRLAG